MINTVKELTREWELLDADPEIVQSLQGALGIHPVLCKLLVQRGIQTYDEAFYFFRPSWDHLHDPFLMKDMDLATTRLGQAIDKGEKILLYGDYDVDGTSSVALMYDFLKPLHDKLGYYIPDRYKEGYGISMTGIRYAVEKEFDLIIAMDCGIKAMDQVAEARKNGVDIIICDHHLPGEVLPDATALLDPKQPGCSYPFKELSGCGVAFKLAQAYAKRKGLEVDRLENLLDILAISIACDIVPMVGENRTLASIGLNILNQKKRTGINALIRASGRETPLTISDLVFGVGPMINAAGRLGDARSAVKVLLSKDPAMAGSQAAFLKSQNEERKKHDKQILEDAIEQLSPIENWDDKDSIVLYQEDWHKGVVGIAASRIVETFYRPTIILTRSNGQIVGSARSVSGFDVYQAIDACSQYLSNYGGHKYAAGLTVREGELQSFTEAFECAVKERLQPGDLTPVLPVSHKLELDDLTPGFFRILRQFAPFGPGNRNPIFISRPVRDSGQARVLKNIHLRMNISQDNVPPIQAIAFGKGHYFEKVSSGQPFSLCYTIEENVWQGRSNLQLMIKDIKFDI